MTRHALLAAGGWANLSPDKKISVMTRRSPARFLAPVALVAVAVAIYVSPGLAAFCGASVLVIWGLVELIGFCGSRFFGDDHR